MAFTGGDLQRFAEATAFQAMAESRRGAVVACREDPPVADEGRANAPSDAGGTVAHDPDDIEEIIIPGRPSGCRAADPPFLSDSFHLAGPPGFATCDRGSSPHRAGTGRRVMLPLPGHRPTVSRYGCPSGPR